MKKNNVSYVGKLRRVLATLFAIIIVVGVPLLSFNQYGHFFNGDSRKASDLTVFNTRAVDASLTRYYLFEEPLISVTFDDGWAVNYTDAFPILHKYGVRTTQYVLSGPVDNEEYYSWDQIVKIHQSGHEIACHSDSHADLTLQDDKQLYAELNVCQKEVTKHAGTVNSFASPYGAADDRTRTAISKTFKSQRNTNGDPSNGVTREDMNFPDNFNPYNIVGVTVKQTTTTNEIQELVDFAVKNNAWLVLTYHQTDDGSAEYAQDQRTLEDQLKILSSSSARIVTVDQAMKSIRKAEL